MAGSDMTVAATSEGKDSPMMLWPYRPTATWVSPHLGGNIYTVRTNPPCWTAPTPNRARR